METQILEKDFYAKLGDLLEYPVLDNWDSFKMTAQEMESFSKEASTYLAEFYSKMKRMMLSQRQEYYVQSFDLMPRCSLYLSVHLFGEESFKRAELMAGLKSVYDKQGEFGMKELPDHLAVVLKRQVLFSDEEWAELVQMCLLPALKKMVQSIEKSTNPYVHILKAIYVFLMETEKSHV